MKFFAVAALFAGALAMPTAEIEARTDHGGHDYQPCPSVLYSNPVCADLDLLQVACLNAAAPSETPTSASNFQSICAKKGQQARCSVLPVLGQSLLCIKPVGVQ